MNDISLATRRKTLLSKYDFHFKKRLGQNFLMDQNVLASIADTAAVSPEDMVVEIGAGSGLLTEVLADHAGFVAAIEVDELLCNVLRELFEQHDNVAVYHLDALKADLSIFEEAGKSRNFEGPFKVVANLPYYITTPLMFHLLEHRYYWSEMTLMMQKEVAERITAKPGTKDYGALTLAVAYDTDATIAMTVPASCFRPRPAVDSAVLHFKRRAFPPHQVEDRRKFQLLVRAAFGQRRKTLWNAVTNAGIGLDRGQVELLLRQGDIDPQRRGETLTFEEFARLANIWSGYQTTGMMERDT